MYFKISKSENLYKYILKNTVWLSMDAWSVNQLVYKEIGTIEEEKNLGCL